MKNFKITISTPVGKFFSSDEVVILNAEILEGRIGILANHSPLISSLKISNFSIKFSNGSENSGIINGGVFNVNEKEVTLLTTKFEWQNEFNIEETKKDTENIVNKLKTNIKPYEEKSLNERLKYNNLKLSNYK